jgi:hypothetical protein
MSMRSANTPSSAESDASRLCRPRADRLGSVGVDEIQQEVGLPHVTAARGSQGNSDYYSPSVTIKTVGDGVICGAHAPAKEPRCETESFYLSSRRR